MKRMHLLSVSLCLSFAASVAQAQTPVFADFSGTPTVAVTAPHTVTFTNLSSSSFTSWIWEFGDGTTSTSKNPGSHTYSAVGCYTVKLTASNAVTTKTKTRTDYVCIDSVTATSTEPANTTQSAPNPCSFETETPVVGSSWDGTVDVAAHEAVSGGSGTTDSVFLYWNESVLGTPVIQSHFLTTEMWILPQVLQRNYGCCDVNGADCAAADPRTTCVYDALTGEADFTVSIPADCVFVGKPLYFQVAVIDSLDNVTWSNLVAQTGGTVAGTGFSCP